ncbi:MAG: DNA-3-methyladenine glycosylase I [Desulfuromonadia bacterium]
MTPNISRCPWCGSDPLYVAYHDREWGVPSHDDRHLFEMLLLEGAQAGLSWITILRKREGYRRLFARFDPVRIASFGEGELARILADPSIVRNRLKVEGAVANARVTLQVIDRHGSLDRYLWRFVEGTPIVNRWERVDQIPCRTPLSERISREMVRDGFRFVGPTIIYSFMQAVGMVNDHLISCFRHGELAERT